MIMLRPIIILSLSLAVVASQGLLGVGLAVGEEILHQDEQPSTTSSKSSVSTIAPTFTTTTSAKKLKSFELSEAGQLAKESNRVKLHPFDKKILAVNNSFFEGVIRYGDGAC